MAAEFGLECEVLEREQMEKLGMGALLGVAQGSAEPPALIVIRYKPAAAKSKDHLGLVGKGVTFDTGGISIKPADGMEKMKYDMGGGAAMMGAMRAIAQLKPPIAVTAFIPCVENMPGSRAQRPGDIVTRMSGKTIEVLNTDAEGRLILADAMAYAKQLGVHASGGRGHADRRDRGGAGAYPCGPVLQRRRACATACWRRRRPKASACGRCRSTMSTRSTSRARSRIWETSADAGAARSRAAMFLKEFAEDTPWVHLDIAGTAWLDDAKPYMAKGPTGVPVRTMVRLATDW